MLTVTSTIIFSIFVTQILSADIGKCMDCIRNITHTFIYQNERLCTETTPQRCGMYLISSNDASLFNHDFSNFKFCARSYNCSRSVIEQKHSKCTDDPCIAHSRDIFLGTKADCHQNYTERMKMFSTCYKIDIRLGEPNGYKLKGKKKQLMSLQEISGLIVTVVILLMIILVPSAKTCCFKSMSVTNKSYTSNFIEDIENKNIRTSSFDPISTSDPVEVIEMELINPGPRVFSDENFSNIEPIGSGHFGTVTKATLKTEDGNEVIVAIKTLLSQNVTQARDEAQIASSLNHPNILTLIGILNSDQNVKLVMPFMEHSDLGKYLKIHGRQTSASQFRSFCLNIASGMEYLASQNIVHRDVAARNCMLNADLIVKIADFGMSRTLGVDHPYYRLGNKSVIPMSSAPECFKRNGTINEKSDVWSFGITFWEIFNYGKVPPVMVQMDGSLIGVAPAGQCPPLVYQLMLKCWSFDQEDRPTFSNISIYLNVLIDNDFKPEMQSIESNSVYITCT